MISIIIPTLNEEKKIEETIVNLRKLSLPLEIIVSDGGSTDKTVEIAQKFADKVLARKDGLPPRPSKERNAGATVASGDYLVFIDSTTTIFNPDEFFKIAFEEFEKRNLIALGTKSRVLPEIETNADKIIFGFIDYLFMFSTNILGFGRVAGKFQMIKKQPFQDLHGYSEILVANEDIDMFNRLSKIGKVWVTPRLTIYHPGRRAHAFGWPKLLFIWMVESIWYLVFKKSYSKVWRPIR